MANTQSSSSQLLMLVLFVLFLSVATCLEHEVGGEGGWKTPKSKALGTFNEWASNNRFIVGDTLRFKYEKDSVMEVKEEEYKKCRSSRPRFFSNNGDTVLELDEPGPFYFISGVSGHCERGLKMVVKVLERRAGGPEPASSHNSTREASRGSSIKAVFGLSSLPLVITFLSFVGLVFLA